MIQDHEADAMTAPHELLGQKNLLPLGPATVGKICPSRKSRIGVWRDKTYRWPGGLRRSGRPSTSSLPGGQPTVLMPGAC